MTYARRVDKNQREIVKALRKCGYKVHDLRKPFDLLVGRAGRVYLLEVKNPTHGSAKLTPAQKRFIDEWGEEYVSVVETAEQALEALKWSGR